MNGTLQTRIEAFLRGETRGLVAAVLRAMLVPPAVLYGVAGVVREQLYRFRLRRAARLPVPVLSVGNLVVGGTGKTPFLRGLARRLIAAGQRPLILSRGYGAKVAAGLDEEGASLARDLPDVPVVQGADRVAAVTPWLRSERPPTVILLDDGAQTLSVARDLDVVLVDVRCPLGSGWPLPAGTLREFARRGLARADLVVLTHAEDPRAVAAAQNHLARLGFDGPVVRSRHVIDRVLPDGRSLAGTSVFAVSGIAHPAGFHRTLGESGATVTGSLVLPDHHAFSTDDVARAEARARESGADLVVATGKDEPKLGPLVGEGLPWAFVEVVVCVEPEDGPVLDAALDGLPETRRAS